MSKVDPSSFKVRHGYNIHLKTLSNLNYIKVNKKFEKINNKMLVLTSIKNLTICINKFKNKIVVKYIN
jgi:hypothetical protein